MQTIQEVVGPKNPNVDRSLDWWKEEIRNGIKYQQLFGRPDEWRRFRAYYRHQWKTGTTLPVNMIFSVIRSLIPQVYFRNPRVFITAAKPGMEMHARTVEAIDNNLIKELDLKRQMKRVIQDAAIQGTGVMWRGYDSEFGWDPNQLDATTGDSTLTMYNARGYRLEYNTYVNPGMPWAQRAELEGTILPWGCRDVRNAEWVAMRVLRPLKDVMDDPKYKNKKNLAALAKSNVGTTNDEFDKIMEHAELVELWQVRDMKTGQIIVLTLDHDKFLREDEDELQIDGLPFHWFTFNDDPTYPWGIPDARIMEPQQLELNETRKQAMQHRRVALLKLLYKRGAMKPEEVEKLLDEDVKAAIAVDTVDGGSLESVVKHITSTIPQELNMWGEIIRGDIREVTGFGRNQTGQAEGGRTTATEAKIVFGAHEIRLDERRDMAADFLEEIMRGVNQTVFKFWNTERVVQIVGPTGLPGWIRYTGEELKGEYNYRIDPNNGAAVSGETRKQDAAQLLQLWAGVGQGAPPPEELARYIFSAYEGINVDALTAQLKALGVTMDLKGSSPENPASMEDVQRGGSDVSPALTGAPSSPRKGGKGGGKG